MGHCMYLSYAFHDMSNLRFVDLDNKLRTQAIFNEILNVFTLPKSRIVPH